MLCALFGFLSYLFAPQLRALLEPNLSATAIAPAHAPQLLLVPFAAVVLVLRAAASTTLAVLPATNEGSRLLLAGGLLRPCYWLRMRASLSTALRYGEGRLRFAAHEEPLLLRAICCGVLAHCALTAGWWHASASTTSALFCSTLRVWTERVVAALARAFVGLGAAGGNCTPSAQVVRSLPRRCAQGAERRLRVCGRAFSAGWP